MFLEELLSRVLDLRLGANREQTLDSPVHLTYRKQDQQAIHVSQEEIVQKESARCVISAMERQ